MPNHSLVERSVAVERLLELRASRDDPPTESVGLARIAGRMLAEPVAAPTAVPQHDRATMDGFAFAADDDYPLTVVDEVFPEDSPPPLERGDAVAVATGAPLPARADAVLMREAASLEGGRLSGPSLSPGTNVYPAGSTAAAGEVLFAAGQRLAARHAALLRDVGLEQVTVHRPLEVGILATGTEISEGRQPDRDSELLCNLVRQWGHEPLISDPVPDERAAVRDGIETAVQNHDLVMTTGGTSVGSADHVVRVLRDHDILFRGVELRPGRPVTVATVDETPVCALPGKPIAAYMAATLVIRSLLTGHSHLPTVSAEFTARVTLPDDDVTFVIPVSLEDDRATPLGHAVSSFPLYDQRFAPGRVASSTRVTLADGVVLARNAIDAGEQVAVVPSEVVE